MQLASLPNGTLVFEYGATDPAISIKENTMMETLLLNYTTLLRSLKSLCGKKVHCAWNSDSDFKARI